MGRSRSEAAWVVLGRALESGGGGFRRRSHHGAILVFDAIVDHAGHHRQAGCPRRSEGQFRLRQVRAGVQALLGEPVGPDEEGLGPVDGSDVGGGIGGHGPVRLEEGLGEVRHGLPAQEEEGFGPEEERASVTGLEIESGHAFSPG